MRSWKDISYAAGLAVVFVASVFAGALAQAGEVRWVATELMPPRWAIWQPNQVMMDEEDLKGGVTFILENPTKEEHAFAVRGMFEMMAEKSTEAVAPERKQEWSTT